MFGLPLLIPFSAAATVGEATDLDRLVERRCVACHAPPDVLRERLPVLPAAVLDGVGGRVRRAWFERVLEPGGHAPGWNASIHESGADPALIDLLVARGGPFETVPPPLDPGELERGRQLYHSVGCVACHAPLELAGDLAAPLWTFEGGFEGEPPRGEQPLDHLARKTGHEALAAFLRDPLAVRPGGEMPSLRLDAGEARAIAAYLLSPEARIDGPAFAFEPGLIAEYFEADDPANVDGMQPTRTDVATDLSSVDALPPHREEGFAFRLRGFVEVPSDGLWSIGAASDDGSRLTLDGELWIDNWGDHPIEKKSAERWLEAGRHSLLLEYYERAGGEGLAVTWSGPDTPEEPIPGAALGHWTSASAPSPERESPATASAAGAERFAALRCGACHALMDVPPPAPAPALLALDPAAPAGCLGDAPAADVPRFAFEPEERNAIARALAEAELLERQLPSPEADAAALERTLERLDCRACHARGGRGGPDEERGLYFHVQGDLDLGDEGRLPPSLDRVGWKLLPDALDAVLLDGDGVRPYMRTRMPDFGAANVGHLPELFTRLDAAGGVGPPPFDARDVELGRELAGRERLGCVQCHDVAGNAGLGIPAADLAYVTERVRYGWFRELLLDPASVGMNSRMPWFFADGTSPAVDVYGGDPARQVAALWTWLSLGAALPLPDGVNVDANEYELVPIDRTIQCGVFLDGASARCVVVGTPQRVHYAYDVENCSLVAAWKGRFFNAEGTWHGRAGHLERPTGEDAVRFARGTPFRAVATGADEDAPWPTRSAAELGYRVLGRRVAPGGTPTFRFAFPAGDGEVEVEETLTPLVAPNATGLLQSFVLSSPHPFRVQHRSGESFRSEAGARGETIRFEREVRW